MSGLYTGCLVERCQVSILVEIPGLFYLSCLARDETTSCSIQHGLVRVRSTTIQDRMSLLLTCFVTYHNCHPGGARAALTFPSCTVVSFPHLQHLLLPERQSVYRPLQSDAFNSNINKVSHSRTPHLTETVVQLATIKM